MIDPRKIQDGDKYFFLGSIVFPIIAWWFFVGSKRYSSKGMK